MSHCPNEVIRGPPWQSGVGIQRDHISNAIGHGGRSALDRNERGIGCSTEKPVEFVQLPPLSFPADPLAFALVPKASTMQDEEPFPSRRRAPVSLVEILDSVGQCGEEILVARHVFVGGVVPIGQEDEMEMALRIRQVVHLEPFDGLFYVRVGSEQRRYHDQGPQFGGHASSELELAKQPGWNAKSDEAIDQGHRDIGGGYEGEDSQEDEDRYANARAPGQEQRAGEHESSEEGVLSEIAGTCMGAPRAPDPDSHGDAMGHPLFEGPPAARHQVVSRVLLAPLGNGESI
jgi:hypothetical protein